MSLVVADGVPLPVNELCLMVMSTDRYPPSDSVTPPKSMISVEFGTV